MSRDLPDYHDGEAAEMSHGEVVRFYIERGDYRTAAGMLEKFNTFKADLPQALLLDGYLESRGLVSHSEGDEDWIVLTIEDHARALVEEEISDA